MTKIARSNPEYVLSLERGLAVIRCFDEAHPVRTLSGVAEATGMTRAAARRFLLTLQSLGYVESEELLFRLTPRTLDLGYAYLASTPWWRHAQRTAEAVGAETRQACAVGVLEGESVVYVAYAPATNLPSLARSPGTRLPAVATAIGRLLIGGLPDAEAKALIKRAKLSRFTPLTITDAGKLWEAIVHARGDGYCVVNQELEVGLRGIGVPIADRGGRIIAAMSLSVRDLHIPLADLRTKLLAPLRRAAQSITRNLAS